MYIITLLILFIVLSHICFIKFKKFKFRYDQLKIKYNELKFKYYSKQWVSGIMSPLVYGMIAGFSTRHYK